MTTPGILGRMLAVLALSLAVAPCCAAAIVANADHAQRCANAFVLTQVVDLQSAKQTGVYEVYEFAAPEQAPALVHRSPLLAVYGTGAYLCDQHLFASVITDPRLKPTDRLDIEEVRPGRTEVIEANWMQRVLGQMPEGRRRYLTDVGTESMFVRNGLLVVHHNWHQLLLAASAPTGYRLSGRNNDISRLSLNGQPAVTVTELLHFDPVARKVVARTPLLTRCSGGTGGPRSYQACGDSSTLLEEVSLPTGSRRVALTYVEAVVLNRDGAKLVPSRWWAKGRTLLMNSLQVSDTQVFPQDIFELIDNSDQPGRLERLSAVPSKTIRVTQGTPDGLLMISPAEKRIWLYDPDTRTSITAPIALTAAEASIPAISHTRDHFLVSEEFTAPSGAASTRLLILNRRLEHLHTLERPGYTSKIVSTARPWPAKRYFDGLTLVPYAGQTVPAAKP